VTLQCYSSKLRRVFGLNHGFGVLAAVLLLVSACDCSEKHAATSAPKPTPSQVAVAPAPVKATGKSVAEALQWLEAQVRIPAGNPASPWALAHGLLAFGKDFTAANGKGALEVMASFAEPVPATERFGFVPQRDGQPVEPHPYLIAKTMLEVGVDPAMPLRASDGTSIDLRRLLTDLRASVQTPTDDHGWHDAAWWISAMELDATENGPEFASTRAAVLSRLEADNAVITLTGLDAFSPTSPMGAAKRGKTHIYGHHCGGLHFLQAVLRGASNDRSPDYLARLSTQVKLLLARTRAERVLYTETLRARPSGVLLVSVQQLKFYGHVLETLSVADEVGLLGSDMTLATDVNDARRQLAADLLVVIAQLQETGAYGQLSKLSEQQPQLALDLIGDGCHAIHGLRNTLSVLPPQ